MEKKDFYNIDYMEKLVIDALKRENVKYDRITSINYNERNYSLRVVTIELDDAIYGEYDYINDKFIWFNTLSNYIKKNNFSPDMKIEISEYKDFKYTKPIQRLNKDELQCIIINFEELYWDEDKKELFEIRVSLKKV